MKQALVALLWLGFAAAAQAEPGIVVVTVSGVRSTTGHVLVAVCDREHFLRETCPYHGRVPAMPGTVTVRIAGVPPGIYAAQAFQDENDNGKIDRSFFGLPTEAIGFSNNARMRFGPPSFNDAAFTLGLAGGAVAFDLRSYN